MEKKNGADGDAERVALALIKFKSFYGESFHG